jgi:hypothetical protein
MVHYLNNFTLTPIISQLFPCEQCEYCGEQYFKAEVLKAIEAEFNAIHFHGKKIKTEIRVPVEPFLELLHA